MTERRSSSGPDDRSRHIDEDLRALAEVTSRDVPELAQVMAAARPLGSKQVRNPFASRFALRLLVPGAVAAGLLALLVPVSYERTAGHDVNLAVASAAGEPRADLVAGAVRSALGASVMATTATGRPNEIQLHAYVPVETVRDPAALVRTLARVLTERGYVVRTSVVPRHERSSGSVYAYARSHWFRVESQGKTSPDIEANLRRKLDEAGLARTSVSVSGDERGREIRLQSNEPRTSGPGRSIGVEVGPGDRAASGLSIVTSRIATAHDGVVLHAQVTAHGQTVSVEVPHTESMSDAALAAEVESRLARAGVHAHVRAKGGTLQIEAR